MKNQIVELDTGTADVTAITPKVLSDTIEEIRRHTKVWGQFFKTNTDLMRNGGTQVEFPKKQTGIAVSWNLSPGSAPTSSSMSYAATTITIAKGGIGLAFQGEAVRQANRDIIADQVREAGLVWKDTLDMLAMEAMFPATSATCATGTTMIVDGTVLIGVKSTIGNFSTGTLIINSGTSFQVNSLSSNATLHFWYAHASCNKRAAGTGISAAGNASLSPKDVLLLRGDIIADGYDPDVVIMHPDIFAEVVFDPSVKFVEKSAYEGEGVVFTGELGKLWGLKLITSNLCPRQAIVMLDTKHVGYEIVRKELDLKRDEYTGASKDVLYFWGFGERNFGVVNYNAYGCVYVHGTLNPGKYVVQAAQLGPMNP